MKNPEIYIAHILDAINTIQKYLKDLSYEQFLKDQKTQDAVVRQLEIIGESAAQLEEEYKQKNSSLPWILMTDMRNKLIHEYFNVDLEIVWQTTKKSLPELRKALEESSKKVA